MGDFNAWLDQLNDNINKNYDDLQARIRQTNDALTSNWTQIMSWIEYIVLNLQSDQNKNQEVLNAILERLEISNDLQLNSPRTPEQSNHHEPLFNMSSTAFSTQGHQIQVKFKLPKYNGDKRQCIAWINKAEEYLDIRNIHYDSEKIKYASM